MLRRPPRIPPGMATMGRSLTSMSGPSTAGVAELASWLRAQIDDDDRVALACTAQGHRRIVAMVAAGTKYGIRHRSQFVADWSPDRVLAEIAATRLILDVIVGTPDEDAVLRLRAVPYASRSGYREEWQPEA